MQATPSKRFTLRVSSQVLFLRTFLLGAGACVATGAFANDAADTETAAAPALDEIVVTATRREENISRVPISITAMSQEMLDTKGIKDFADVARFTPGVSFDTSQTNQISIRGINSSSASSELNPSART